MARRPTFFLSSTIYDFRDLRSAIKFKRGLAAHPITLETRHRPCQTVDLDAWNDFTTVFFQVIGLRFETVVIDDALTSTLFLDYVPDRGGYVQSAAYEALSKLWDEIRQFNGLSTMDNMAIIFETTPKALGRKTGPYDLSTDKVALLYGLAHRWINIVSLCQALITHLAGQPFQAPELMPFSPIQGLEEHILAERVSPADLRKVFGLDPAS